MKILKNDDASLLLKNFGKGGKDYLSISVLSLFDFATPELPEAEKDLWDIIGNEMEPGCIFDLGMPKPIGEVLLRAHCFTPDGRPRQAQNVSFSVGTMRKELHVFGVRRWVRKGGIASITEPESFTSVPISWSNAFGGSEYAFNTFGKGEEGGELPQVEYPDHIIGAPSDTPPPATFGPIDPGWKPRAERVGDYGGSWLRDNWPHAAENMDWRYYNAASEDQWLDVFFEGGEDIYLENMHPEQPRIASTVPRYRQRVFLMGKGDALEAPLREPDMRVDTLWLFPHLGKGALIHRATARVRDDESSDVAAVFVRTEQHDEQPMSPEAIREAIAVRLARPVDMDAGAADERSEEFKQGDRNLAAVDEKVDAMLKEAAGGGKVPSPKKMAAMGEQAIERGLGQLDDGIARLKAVKSQWGHLAPITAKPLVEARKKLVEAGKQVAAGGKQAQDAADKAEAARAEAMQALQNAGVDDLLEEQGKNLPDLLLEPKEIRWNREAYAFVANARDRLAGDDVHRRKLVDQGISEDGIRTAWLGWNREVTVHDRRQWGVEVAGNDSFSIPEGVVVPHFVNHKVAAIHVFSVDDFDVPKAVVEGSSSTGLHLAAHSGEPLFIVPTIAEALVLHGQISMMAGVVVANLEEETDEDTAALLGECPRLIICKPRDYRRDATELEAWSKLSPAPEFAEYPWDRPLADVALSEREEDDIRGWAFELLYRPYLLETDGSTKEGGSAAPPDLPTGGEPKKPSVAARASKSSVASIQADLSAAEKKHAAAIKQAHEELGKLGISRQILHGTTGEPDAPESPVSAAPEAEKAASKDTVKPEKKPAGGDDSSTAGKGSPAKTAAAEAQSDHEKGESLKGRKLKGADFTGLDMSGADFADADLTGAIFREAKLDGADFRGARAVGADFMRASLNGTKFDKALLHNAIFRQARGEQASFVNAILEKADFSGVYLADSIFDDAIMDRTKFANGDLSGSSFVSSTMLDTNLDETVLDEANMERAFLQNGHGNRTSFKRAVLPKISFQGFDGNGCSFAGADMINARGGRGNAFRHADFKGAKLNESYFEDSDFSGADFTGCEMDVAGFDRCTMQGAKMQQLRARNSSFNKSDLSGCAMRAADLMGASLRKTRLVSADLTGASLFGADLYKAILNDTRLDGTNFKRTLLEQREDSLKWNGMMS